MKYNTVQSAVYGHAIGDALGVPADFSLMGICQVRCLFNLNLSKTD